MQPVINLTKYEYSTGPENLAQLQPSGMSKNFKVLSPTGKRNDHKTYIQLRDVSLAAIKDVKSLKELIVEQFSSRIVLVKLSNLTWDTIKATREYGLELQNIAEQASIIITHQKKQTQPPKPWQ